jgi:hypothetical protein
LQSVLEAVNKLPASWHGAGSFRPEVLAKIADYAQRLDIRHSVETGTGKSTLLFSHLSAHHTVFAKDDTGDGDSLRLVQESPILRKESVEFKVGPTQKTLPSYDCRDPLQLILIDGPHGYPFPDLEYYFLYPHLEQRGLLIVDDINIPTVFRLFEFLREDLMFELLETVYTTAIFRRTTEKLFDPFGDGWWTQEFNRTRFPVRDNAIAYSMTDKLKALVPQRLKAFIRGTIKSV